MICVLNQQGVERMELNRLIFRLQKIKNKKQKVVLNIDGKDYEITNIKEIPIDTTSTDRKDISYLAIEGK